MSPMSLELAEMPADWTRALAVVAHPDDMEYGGAAAVARWTSEGKEVAYLLASRGEAGIDSLDPVRSATLRVEEQIASAAVVGVTDVVFLDYPDGVIEYGLPLRRDIALAIRRFRPEMVLMINHHETFGWGNLNMADHRNVGWATLDAIRDAANRWVFDGDSEPGPWSGVRWAAVGGSPQATHALDITDTIDRGIASLQEHAAYLEALGDHPMADADAFLRGMAEMTGARFGDRLSTAFELIEF